MWRGTQNRKNFVRRAIKSLNVMNKFSLIIITFIAASCTSVAKLPSNTVEVRSKEDCSGYAVTKSETMTDSVRIQVDLKSCQFNETIYGTLLLKDKNNVVSRFQTDVNGQVTLVLKEGKYSIQFTFIHFKSLLIPLRTYENGNYLVRINAAFDDPIIN